MLAQCEGMMTFTELASVPSDPMAPFTDRLRLAVAAYLAASRAPPASTPNLTCAATWPGAPSTAWTRSASLVASGVASFLPSRQ